MGDHVFRRRLPRTASNGKNLRVIFSPHSTRKVLERLQRVRSLDHSNTQWNVHFPVDENTDSSTVNSITNVVVPVPCPTAKSNKKRAFVDALAVDCSPGEIARSMLAHPSVSSLTYISQLEQLLPFLVPHRLAGPGPWPDRDLLAPMHNALLRRRALPATAAPSVVDCGR